MKLLVVSDVHGELERFKDICSMHKDADYVISLGDSELKSHYLQSCDVISIKGNYPRDAGFTYEHIATFNAKRFLLIHGHKYKVQYGYDKLYYKILETEVDFVLHGHTHIRHAEKLKNTWVINPGSVGKSRTSEPESYAVFSLNKDQDECLFYNAHTHDLIERITL